MQKIVPLGFYGRAHGLSTVITAEMQHLPKHLMLFIFVSSE
jgi:hypothetical protein